MKKFLLILFLLPILAVGAVAQESATVEKEPFSDERFTELQAAGEVVLVDVFADWCPTCARQQEILAEYRTENPDKAFTILEVDFDEDKDLVRRFRAPRQSTFLLFSGENQIWYSVAETRSERIFEELDKAFEHQAMHE